MLTGNPMGIGLEFASLVASELSWFFNLFLARSIGLDTYGRIKRQGHGIMAAMFVCKVCLWSRTFRLHSPPGGAAWAKVATAQMGSTLCRQATENCHSQTVHPMRFPMYVVKVEVWVQLQNFIMNFSQHFQVFQ